ncbi:MAG: leucine-rich repeat domain-containing protein, partial [Lachnospiraceae bacterium]|nr:leucine-rich repeat domain-containing protein [Lachnospiraceae bacterium]
MRKDIQVKIKKILAVGLASFMAFTSVPYMSAANNVYASDLADSGTVDNPYNGNDNTITFKGCSVDLEDNIHLKFYLNMADDTYTSNKSKSKVVFTVGGETTEVAMNYATKVSDNLYSITCPVFAKQMADDVTAEFQVLDAGDYVTSAAATYSVKEYGEYIISHPGDYGESVVTTVKAMLNYGGYSQQYFGYNTENLANANCKKEDYSSTANSILSGYAYTSWEKVDGWSYDFGDSFKPAYIRYMINDSVDFEILFYNGIDALKNHTITFKDSAGNKSYQSENVTMNGTQYIKVTIPKLHARKLCDNIQVWVYDNGIAAGSFTISPKNYMYQVIAGKPSVDVPLQLLIASLYDYYKESKAYYDQYNVAAAEGLTSGDFVYNRIVFGGQIYVEITGYTGSGPVVNIPKQIDSYNVEYVGDGTHSIFDGNKNVANITQIVIDNNVKHIRKLAFAYFKEPIDVNLNTNYWNATNSPIYPYVQGFGGQCTANIPNSLISVGDGAFTGIKVSQNSHNTTVTADVDGNVYQGTVLKSASDFSEVVGRLRINSNVTEIAPYAVYGCANYNYVVLPETLTKIGEYA